MTTKNQPKADALAKAQAQKVQEAAQAQAEAKAAQEKHLEKINKRFNKCLKAVSGLAVQDVHQIAEAMKNASNQSEYIYRDND